MAWDIGKVCCLAVFFALRDSSQIDKKQKFSKTRTLTMGDLLFFNNLASDDLRRQEATMLAGLYDNRFTNIHLTQYVGDNNRQTCMAGMIDVLMQKDKTVEDLSDFIDSCYTFSDEN
jgi:hypothetical protein